MVCRFCTVLFLALSSMEEEEIAAFHSDLIRAIFKIVWSRRALERQKVEAGVGNALNSDAAGTSKKNKPTSVNANAVKLAGELLGIFIKEAVQRAGTIAEAEGVTKIEATHLERILPQFLLDF